VRCCRVRGARTDRVRVRHKLVPNSGRARHQEPR
jgi:hypothetical protein